MYLTPRKKLFVDTAAELFGVGSTITKTQKAAAADDELAAFVATIDSADTSLLEGLTIDEIDLLKKITSLQDILHAIEYGMQTHLLAYYTWQLAQSLHNTRPHRAARPGNQNDCAF